MFNILANTFFIASRNPQHHKTDCIRFKQRQVDNASEDLFQKDLYKSTLTGFYLKMQWKKICPKARAQQRRANMYCAQIT